VIVPYQFSFGCKIVIRDIQTTHNPIRPIPPLEFDFGMLKGMNGELKRLAGTLNSQLPQKPILIVGPSGTGKTSVLETLSNGKWATFKIDESTIISPGSKVKGFLSRLFSEARETLPAMIIIDDLDLMAPRDAPSAFGTVLSQEIRNNLNGNIRIVASAKRPLDLNQCFAWTFPRDIELPVPTLAARKEILRGYCESASDELLDHVSERTHAFVPGDIWRLCSKAEMAAEIRVNDDHTQSAGIPSADSRPKLRILEEDFEVALRSVHPSAMSEVFIDVPNVRWSDIGGSEYLKGQLQLAARLIFEVRVIHALFIRQLTMRRLLLKARRYLK
jgi:SpoVK/Ycf46/Vps4 family AAA+-type ATPase